MNQITKRMSVLAIVGCLMTAPALASDHAVSAACDAKSGEVLVKHKGQTFIAALETYRLKLTFTAGQQSFDLQSSWGPNFQITLDSESETLTTRFTSASGRFFNGISPAVYLAPAKPEATLLALSQTATYLAIAKSRLKRGQSDEGEQIAAIDCAQERLKAYAALVRRKYIQFRNLGIQDGNNPVGGNDVHK